MAKNSLRWFLSVALCIPTVHDFLLHLIACANERVHEHNDRNFPQAKLNSGINACFLLNGLCNLYLFYCIIMVYILSSLIKKENFKILPEGKKRYRWKSAQNGYSVMMQIMTAKTTTLRTLYVHAVLNSVMFPQFFMILFYMLDSFYLSRFFPKPLPQNVTWTDE